MQHSTKTKHLGGIVMLYCKICFAASKIHLKNSKGKCPVISPSSETWVMQQDTTASPPLSGLKRNKIKIS